MLTVYHRTSSAEQILAEGFRDGEGTYMTTLTFRGVWVADRPLDENDGAAGDRVLAIQIPESVIEDYEWIEDGKFLREWLIPADLLNQYRVTEVIG